MGKKTEDSPSEKQQGQEAGGARQSKVELILTRFPVLGNFEPRAGRACDRCKNRLTRSFCSL